MADVLTSSQRAYCMSRIRAKDTNPELVIRRLVHAMGYRFRLHRSDLPGKPDLVFPRLRAVILVHGCFWHMHSCRWGRVTPKTHAEFWSAKRQGTVARDKRNLAQLRSLGWSVLTVWECQIRDTTETQQRLAHFLST